MNAPEVVRILKVKEENSKTKTFTLDKKISSAFPGQFAMVWIPNVGEKPFSFSKIEGNVEFTVKEVGRFTKKFCSLKEGDLIGIRGPYGNSHFSIKGKNVCVVVGGIGIAPLMPIIESKEGKKKFKTSFTVLFGAKNKNDVLFIERINKIKNCQFVLTTEDGSLGKEGLCVDFLKRIIEKKKIDQILTCGPEMMMKKVADIALKKKIPCQLSLERYMKCGIGICGTCCLDPKGLRVCKEGPIFTAHELKDSEFGKYRRDSSGEKICNL